MRVVKEHAHVHDTHPAIIARLKRAVGHLKSTISMIEVGRPCIELAQQLHAIEKAILVAKKKLIHDHIDHCLAHAQQDGHKDEAGAIDQFKAITKYL